MSALVSLSCLCGTSATGQDPVVWDTHDELMQWVRVFDPNSVRRSA